MSEELVEYIKKNLDAGYSAEAIKKQLLKNGWDEKEVSRAMHKARGGSNIVVIAGFLSLIFIFGLTYFLWPSPEVQPDFDEAQRQAEAAQNMSEPACRDIPDDYAQTQCFYEQAMNDERSFCDSESPQRCENNDFVSTFENATVCVEEMEDSVIFCRQALVEAFEDKRDAEAIESQTDQTV